MDFEAEYWDTLMVKWRTAVSPSARGGETEAVNCLLDYVFGKIGKHRVIAVADTQNTPAVRLLERVGMRREGHFLENVWFKGEWGDESQYAMLEREWLAMAASQ
jgi:RimJ/RimL family protein N-acetyltransferase